METTDIYVASWLLAKGFSLAGKERRMNKIAIKFDADDSIEKESMAFYNGGEIVAKKYVDSMRTIRDFIFDR